MLSEKIKKSLEEVNGDILNIYNNPDLMRDYLGKQLRFSHYSPLNRAYLHHQCPTATYVATYNQWKKLGYPVKEKGCIYVLSPSILQGFIDAEGKFSPISKATDEQKKQIENGDLKKKNVVLNYRKTPVFDISHTDATEEDLVKLLMKKNKIPREQDAKDLYSQLSEYLNLESNKSMDEEKLYDIVYQYTYDFIQNDTILDENDSLFITEAITFTILNQFQIDNSLFKYKALSGVHWDTETIEKLHKVNRYICLTSENLITDLASAF